MAQILYGLIALIGAVLVTYALFVVGIYSAQRFLLYRPDANSLLDPSPEFPSPQILDQRTTDGIITRSWYWPAQPKQPSLVYFHGNSGNISHRLNKISAYLQAGLGVILVGYRGYGGNKGKPTEQGWYADARALLSMLPSQGINQEFLVLYGESLGSGVAVQMAQEYPVAALILEAPLRSAPDVAAYHYPFVPTHWLMWDRFDNIKKIANIDAPLLILHGHQDRVVPFSSGLDLYRAGCDPKWLKEFPEAGHNDLYDHGAAEWVLDFLYKINVSSKNA